MSDSVYMKCSYSYSRGNYPHGSIYCFDDLHSAIVGKQIDIVDYNRDYKTVGTVLINGFISIDLWCNNCKIFFNVIQLDHRYVDKQFVVIGPYFKNRIPRLAIGFIL